MVNKLDSLRGLMASPLILTSAYRCPEHPEEIKKKKGGTHTQGIAVDIRVFGIEQIRLVKHAYDTGFRGFGIANTFLHIDLRREPAKWIY